METKKLLKALTDSIGVTGSEYDFACMLKEMLSKYTDECYVNKFNSCIGVKRSKYENAQTVLLEAHLDQIGMMVSEIDDNGFVKFVSLGGIDPRILPAAEVYILGKENVYGVIGAKPPHLMTKEDSEKSAKITDMLIDTGYKGDRLRELISVGDSVVLKSEFSSMLNESVSSKAMDNRAGITAVFGCLEKLRGMELDYNIAVLFSSEEEMGLYGAYTADFKDTIDLAVVVDVTHGMTPDSKDLEGVFPLDSGAVICRGPNLHPKLTNRVIEIAKRENISYDIEAAAGSSGTDAWAIQTLKSGIPTVLISIPLKYMHTSVEVLSLNDIESVSRLMAEIVKGGILDA